MVIRGQFVKSRFSPSTMWILRIQLRTQVIRLGANHLFPESSQWYTHIFFKFCFVYLERPINEVFGISQQGYVSPEDVPNDLRRITRGLQVFELKSRAKPFSFLLLKKAKHEVMFTVSLSKYKYSKGLHLVLCLIIFGHVKRTRNILCRFLSLRDNIDMPGHFLHVLDFKGIHLP